MAHCRHCGAPSYKDPCDTCISRASSAKETAMQEVAKAIPQIVNTLTKRDVVNILTNHEDFVAGAEAMRRAAIGAIRRGFEDLQGKIQATPLDQDLRQALSYEADGWSFAEKAIKTLPLPERTLPEPPQP